MLTGSNLSFPLLQLEKARKQVSLLSVNKQVGHSRPIKSSPWGNTEQPDFYNQLLVIRTFLPPLFLLKCLQKIERSAGRVRKEKWAARTLDIDILYYNHHVLHLPDLQVPHPHLHQRRFTLVLLHALFPDFEHPILKASHTSLLLNCTDNGTYEFI